MATRLGSKRNRLRASPFLVCGRLQGLCGAVISLPPCEPSAVFTTPLGKALPPALSILALQQKHHAPSGSSQPSLTVTRAGKSRARRLQIWCLMGRPFPLRRQLASHCVLTVNQLVKRISAQTQGTGRGRAVLVKAGEPGPTHLPTRSEACLILTPDPTRTPQKKKTTDQHLLQTDSQNSTKR